MASPSLYEFISQIKGEGLSRTNRFLVNIASPAALGGSDARLIQLYCEQAALPGMAYASTPVRSFGENREVVYERNFEPIALTFYVDRKMSVLSFFNDWMDTIVNPNTRESSYYDDYTTQMNITVQDVADNDTYEVEFREVYPKSVGAIQLDYNSKDVAKLTVTFNYKYHINKRKDPGGGDGELLQQLGLPFVPGSDVYPDFDNSGNYAEFSRSDVPDSLTGDATSYYNDGIDIPIDYTTEESI